MVKIIFLSIQSGFSNRLLPIISCYDWCNQNGAQLYVIWKPHTNRGCIGRHENNVYYNLHNYFESVPDIIKVFGSYQEAINCAGNVQPVHINMNWGDEFNRSILNNDYIHFYYCCNLVFFKPQNIQSVFWFKNDIEIYKNHPYIKHISKITNDFRIKSEIIAEAKKLYKNGMVGIQLRVTDGGFVKNNSDDMNKQIKNIISENDLCYFTTDNQTKHNEIKVLDKVVVYDNLDKFQNNDIGSYYSLVDLVVLSMCETTYICKSTFAQLAFLFNQNVNKHYILHGLDPV